VGCRAKAPPEPRPGEKDGCTRQNPAYRPAKGKPRSGGVFLWVEKLVSRGDGHRLTPGFWRSFSTFSARDVRRPARRARPLDPTAQPLARRVPVSRCSHSQARAPTRVGATLLMMAWTPGRRGPLPAPRPAPESRPARERAGRLTGRHGPLQRRGTDRRLLRRSNPRRNSTTESTPLSESAKEQRLATSVAPSLLRAGRHPRVGGRSASLPAELSTCLSEDGGTRVGSSECCSRVPSSKRQPRR
jgi:hypothetical protein